MNFAIRFVATFPASNYSSIICTFFWRTSKFSSFAAICYSLRKFACFSSSIYCLVRLLLLPVYSKFTEIPLLALRESSYINKDNSIALTTHSCGGFECVSHFLIHLDHQVPFVCYPLVPRFFLEFDPLIKLLTNGCRTDIGDPLLRCLWQLNVGLRQVGVYFWVPIIKVLPDLFDS